MYQQNDYLKYLEGVLDSYSAESRNLIDENEPEIYEIFDRISEGNVGINEGKFSDRIIINSIINRTVGVFLLFENLYNHSIYEEIWPFFYKSLSVLESRYIISTMSSQGFLSIPLFHQENDGFGMLRLHIWHKDLIEIIDSDKVENFSIHCHKFYATSWILKGEVFNHKYFVKESESSEEFCLFKVEWDNTSESVNQKNSKNVNTGIFVNIQEIETESFVQSDFYNINAGEYHKSSINLENEINSTLFYFNSNKGQVDQSYVVGPSIISEVNTQRKKLIESKYLLDII